MDCRIYGQTRREEKMNGWKCKRKSEQQRDLSKSLISSTILFTLLTRVGLYLVGRKNNAPDDEPINNDVQPMDVTQHVT